ncbi:DoxX family protein [Porticoccus sp.]|uniref:DoxX family protein n=1 Tax=Porticoccus sp. TaxID=2024853 RepID=UPI003F6954FB
MTYYEELAKLVLRIAVGLLVLLHGIAKILNPDSLGFIGGKLAEFGIPAEIAYAIYLGEVLGPLMIVFGYFARAGALLVIGNMIAAILLVHAGELFQLTKNGGWALELQGLYLVTALVIALQGSGKYAIRPD